LRAGRPNTYGLCVRRIGFTSTRRPRPRPRRQGRRPIGTWHLVDGPRFGNDFHRRVRYLDDGQLGHGLQQGQRILAAHGLFQLAVQPLVLSRSSSSRSMTATRLRLSASFSRSLSSSSRFSFTTSQIFLSNSRTTTSQSSPWLAVTAIWKSSAGSRV